MKFEEFLNEVVVKYWINWLMGLLSLGLASLWRQVRKTSAEQKAIQEGVIALIRDRILIMHSICISKGFASVQERDALEFLYTAYHEGLKRNGTITDIYNKTKSLPIDRPSSKKTDI